MPPSTEKRVNEESSDHVSLERTLTRRVLWKLDIHVLPALSLLWLANFLDRTNIGNAGIAGLRADLHLHGNQFNVALTVYYVSYIISELPSNWVVKRIKPTIWLPALVGGWGIVTTLSGLITNYSGLIAIRWFLGLLEGGLLPGMVLYLSTIYKRHELQLRVGIFYSSASISGAFGGLLASAISKMDGIGGLAGWRWIFILEGIATVVVAAIAMLVLPESIEKAKFFTLEERRFALQRFRAENFVASQTAASVCAVLSPTHELTDTKGKIPHAEVVNESTELTEEKEAFEWREVRRGILDVQVWLTGFSYMGLVVGLYSFSLFLPTIVTGLGYSGPRAQLQTVPPYVPAIVMTVVVAILADRLKWRGPFILIFLPFAIIGYGLAIAAKTNHVRYGAFFLMALGIYPCGPCILSILPNNSSGHYKKATTTALQLMVANIGGFVATFAYTADQAPEYKRGHTIALSFVCMSWVFMAVNVGYCIWENRARREGRRQCNVAKYQRLWEVGKTRAPIGDRSPDFQFTL